MSQWSLNCYLYAPKDDDKHRASWRELYQLEEAGNNNMHMLINGNEKYGYASV